MISLYDWEFSDSIPLGEPFRIDAACVNNQLMLGVNGVLLAEVTDDTFDSGRYGLVVGTGEQGDFTVVFDNYSVYEVQSPPAAANASGNFDSLKANANILVYDLGPSFAIRDFLDALGYNYTYLRQKPGGFAEQLTSDTVWDLIIIGAENGDTQIGGEVWDKIYAHVNQGAALIAEVSNLDTTANGQIKSLLADCGIAYKQDLTKAQEIILLVPDHPVFTEPNKVASLSLNRNSTTDAGDLISLVNDSAQILAGTNANKPNDFGQIATCIDNRVIFQTFSNFDYNQEEINLLWQNYVEYTLDNHFRALSGGQ